MDSWNEILEKFVIEANSGDLKTAHYPKEWLGLSMKVSFGMGAPARVPWIGLRGDDSSISHGGINPVYLYYKDEGVLILSYGVSETGEVSETWPAEIINNTQTIESFFDKKVPRYGDSFVFKSYKVEEQEGKIVFLYPERVKASPIDLESDLKVIVDYYQKVLSLPSHEEVSESRGRGLFYMEKQLEDFIIHNWDNTELGKKYDLLIEEGELKSQQYRTDIGPIDILAKDKKTKEFVVIELKRDQTSDDTVGQLARYMGWVEENLKGKSVKGVIIAGKYDTKLYYALKRFPDVEVFLYEVDFSLKKFEK